ncbi:MAG: S1 family peptidase, partial [Myxococcota bacterium]
MRTISKLALATLGASALACSADGFVPERSENREEAIIYGDLDYTHQAVVAVFANGGVCTGTIVDVQGSSAYVLTAAHCVTTSGPTALWPGQITVAMGNDYDYATQYFDVAEVEFHPLYDGTDGSANDFGMLRITGTSSSTPYIPPLTPAEDSLQVGTNVNLVGYGRTESGYNNSERRIVQKPIDDLSSAWLMFDQTGTSGGTCQGDSGGPALTLGAERVAAVTSFGTGANCAADGYSGRVSTVYDSFVKPFIDGTTGTISCDECHNAVTAGAGACVSDIEACFSSSACNSFYNCLVNCTTTSCQNQCVQNNPTGADMYNAIYECICSSCSTECANDPLCAGPTGCGLTTGDQACDDCFHASCESECAAATEEPTLSDYLTCAQGCSTQACLDGCDSQYPAAAAAYGAFDACIGNHCASECGISSGGCGLTTGDPTCDDCFQTACESECEAATAEPDLMDYLQCAQGCSDQACYDSCEAQYPTAAQALGALDTCMGAECATECGAGGSGGSGGSSGSGGSGGFAGS